MKNVLLFLVIFFLNSVSWAQTPSVGSTESVFDVSDLGGVNYSIPIKVPDGVGGLQPSLSLSYNSQLNNGIMGMGWSIAGTSSITRSANTIYGDKKVAGISNTAEDRFSLDGNRLLLASGSYGAAGSTYRSELETFRNIVASGSIGTAPQSFVVTDQDGRIFEYGTTAASRPTLPGKTEPYAWMLDKVTDLKGNSIRYTYTYAAGEEPRLSNVTYNVNATAGSTGSTGVAFVYEARPDPNFSYSAGGKITQGHRLTYVVVQQVDYLGIDVYNLKTYQMTYTTDMYTHLQRVTEKGNELSGTAPETLTPTEFSYGTATSPGLTVHSELQVSVPYIMYAPGDYNGDGKTDIVKFSGENANNSFSLYLGQGSPNAFTLSQSGTLNSDPSFTNLKNTLLPTTQAKSMAFDYNGDGKDDFVYIQNQQNSACKCSAAKQKFYIYLSNGTSLSSIDRPIVGTATAGVSDQFGNLWPLLGDFDGDGKSEIFAVTANPNSSYNISYLIGERYNTAEMTNGPTNSPTPYPVYVPKTFYGLPFTGANGAKLLVIDYNGDGKSDILHINGSSATVYEMNVTYDANNLPVIGTPAFKQVNSTGYPSQWHEAFTGDFNGDGITDLLTYHTSVGWEIGYGKGDGLMNDIKPVPAPMAKPFGGFYNDLRPILIADFNGDGKDDIFDYSSSTDWGQAYAPRLFASKGNNTFVTEAPTMNTSLMSAGAAYYWIGDFNSDGQADFITRSIYSSLPYVMSLHANENRHLITQIKNGLSANTKIDYLALNNSAVYTGGTDTYSYPFVKKGIPIKVVSTVARDNGTSTTGNNTNYTYQGLRMHSQGKGVMGFEKIAASDVVMATTQEKSYGLNTTYAYPYLQNVTKKQGTTLLTSTSSYYSIHDYGNKRIFPFVMIRDNNDYGKNVSIREEYSYVSPAPGIQPEGFLMGKPNKITTRKGYTSEVIPGQPTEREITVQLISYVPYFQNPYPAPYIYSKPIGIVTETTRHGQPMYSRVEYFGYYPADGLLQGTTTDPGTANAVTTSYLYNAYGNVIQKTQSSAGLPSKTEQYEYDVTNRYVTKSYNTAYPSVQTNSVYNFLTGNLLSVTEPDGYQTNYTYDGFGRVKTKSDNNGKAVTTNYLWASGHPYATTFSQYIIETVSNDAAPSYVFYDRLGRVSRTATKGYNGQMIFTDDRYDTKGFLVRRSNPYFQGVTLQNRTFGYDVYGRMTYNNNPGGNNFTYTYSLVGGQLTTTTTNAAGQVKKVSTDRSGVTVKTEDEGGTLTYTYHSNGHEKNVVLNNSVTVQETEYDAFGRKTKGTDPNYGSYEYTYNAYNEMTSQKDPKGVVYNYTYEGFGGIKTKTGPEGTYTYTYHTATGPNSGKMIQLTGPGCTQNYSYGMGDKVSYEEKILGSEVFKTEYTYDTKGRVDVLKFPNGKQLKHSYSAVDGSLVKVNVVGAPDLYFTQTKNAFGKITAYGHGFFIPFEDPEFKLTTLVSYDNYGLLTAQKTTTHSNVILRDQQYQFNPQTGNLSWRKDIKRNLQEDFTYDNLNRLKVMQGQITGSFPAMLPTQSVDYTANENGNIWKKSDAGTFGYDQANRVSEIDPYVNIPGTTQNITYTPFNKVATIGEGPNSASFSYWADGERGKMELLESGVLKKTKFYAADYEKEVDAVTGVVRDLCYITGPQGDVIAILERKNGVDKTYFVLTDHLGSLTHIVDEFGNIIEEKSFDAWGRARSALNWAPLSVTGASNGWDRGYTGHEHIPQFGIINMNGRLYDPLLGRMLSPDPYVMGGDNTQGYNRYSYALNNPLSYTDPNGEWINFVVGAVVGGLSNWMFNGAEISLKGLGHFGVGAVVGAGTVGIGVGVGAALGSMSGFVSGAITGAATGFGAGFGLGLGNGLLNGDGFGSALTGGIKKGAIGALSGSLIGGLSEGIESVADGKRFWDGATVEYKELTLPTNVPNVQQIGDNNCGPAAFEAADKSLGGSVTQQDIRTRLGGNPNTDPLMNDQVAIAYKDLSGRTITGTRLINYNAKDAHDKLVAYMNTEGNRITLSLPPSGSGDVGHQVAMKGIYQKVVNGVPKRIIYKIMDPWFGKPASISLETIRTAHAVFIIK